MVAPIDDETRPRGFLTTADREYLLGTSDLEPYSHGERRARERIRERYLNALRDLVLVEEHLQDRDHKQVLEKLLPDDGTFARSHGMWALQALASLTFEAALQRDVRFHELAKYGVGTAMRRRIDEHLAVTVDANISATVTQAPDGKLTVARIEEKLDKGLPSWNLSDGEKATLFDKLLARGDSDPVAEAIEITHENWKEAQEGWEENQTINHPDVNTDTDTTDDEE